MSSPTLLLAGATGYIGGTFLTLFHDSHSSFSIRCIVRDESQAALLTSFYSSIVTPVVGSLSDIELLRAEASKASVVVNGVGENPGVIQALIEGISRNPQNDSARKTKTPLFIHISGTSSVSHDVLGESSSTLWSDVDSYDDILGLEKGRIQVATDRQVRQLSRELHVNSIILAPPTILGHGLGAGRTETFQPLWYDAILDNGAPFLLGKGENIWSVVSVKDLGRAILFVVDKVLAGSSSIEFGDRGYYYVEAFEVSLMDRAIAIGERLVSEGKIKSGNVELLSVEEIERKYGKFMTYLVGSSSRVKADRLKSLGWQPVETDWKALVEEHGGRRC